jgi:hypothetical protein
MKSLLVLLLLAALAGAFFWERGASQQLRADNASLRADQEEAARLTAENAELATLRATSAEPLSTADRSELLRLRNEVRRLRDQRAELDKLRTANARVAEEIKAGKFTPRRLADEPGAVPRDKWVPAGFATPEAAVQSFFAAVVSSDPSQLLACGTPKFAEMMKKEMARDPEKFRQEFQTEMGKLATASAFRIVELKPKGDGTMEAKVQFTINGEAMPLPLQQVGNEWKVGD